ncbi:MAG: hypothetical protein AB1744_07475, partial [Candidatus Zixiibacteriota bacterium]
GNSGTVFITLEPMNFNTDTTNFPLIVLRGAIPTDSLEAVADTQELEMDPFVQTNDPYLGFPKVIVTIRRF